MTNEIKYREIEALLNEALAASMPLIKSEGIEHRSRSITSYNYKSMDLEWLHDFSIEWKANYERACTIITVCFRESTLPNELMDIKINSSIFSEGRDSRVEIKKSYEIEINELLSLGLLQFLKNTFSLYKTELEEHM